MGPDSVDVVSDLIRDIGSVAAALAAIGGVLWAVVHFGIRALAKQVHSIVDEATLPLRPNGGSSVGDLPDKVDKLADSVDDLRALVGTIENRQITLGCIEPTVAVQRMEDGNE